MHKNLQAKQMSFFGRMLLISWMKKKKSNETVTKNISDNARPLGMKGEG